jgi:hypothetical protein
MAKEDSVRTTTTRTAGGSPYLQSFVQPAEVARTAQFDRELAMSRENRAQQSFDMSNARESRMDEEARVREARLQHKEDRQTERQKFMDDWRMRQEDRNHELDKLKFRHQEAIDNKNLADKREETTAAEAIATISSLNPQKLSFGYDARGLMSSDRGLQAALVSKHGKAVKAALDERMASNNDVIKHFQQRAADAGLAGDIMGYADKMGMMDEVKFSQALESARAQKAIKEAAQAQQKSSAMEQRAKQLGLVPTKLDPKTEEVTYGLPKPELFGKTPPPNTSTPPQAQTQAKETANNPITKEVISALADELGPNATKQNLMDLARQRGYTF